MVKCTHRPLFIFFFYLVAVPVSVVSKFAVNVRPSVNLDTACRASNLGSSVVQSAPNLLY
jgi:hypothetical protein